MGAGNNTNPAQPVSISVSPSTTSLKVGSTEQFTATVTNTNNTKVTWAVNDVAGGNSDVGTISSNGLYKAPASVPSPATVTIKATSQADTTKSATAKVSVTLSITVSPQSPSVEVFHSQQFEATVSGVSNMDVTWSVNQIQGGNLSVGQIDSTGHYVAPNQAPSPSTVTVTATSEEDATQSASTTLTILPDKTPPAISSTTPADGATQVPLNSTISIQFSDALDPATVDSSTFSLTNGTNTLPAAIAYNPTSHVVTLTPQGIFSPGVLYTVTVNQQVSDPAGLTLGSNYTLSFTTQPTITTNATVTPPTTLNPTALTVISGGGKETTPDSSGNFNATLAPLGNTTVAAMVPGEPFGLLAITAVAPQSSSATVTAAIKSLLSTKLQPQDMKRVRRTRWQITASPHAMTSSANVVVDFQTTAESILFLTPYLYQSDPAKAQVIMTAIAANPDTASLAQALAAAWNEQNPLQDSTVQAALQKALISILQTLASSTDTKTSTQPATQQSQMKGETATVLSSASTSTSQSSLQITPYCWNQSPSSQDTLPCLDLEYLSLNSSVTPDSNNNYDVSVKNCSFGPTFAGFQLGCATSWLLEVAAITNPPTNGIDSLYPGDGSNGQLDSPAGDFAPSCTLNSQSGSCKFIWIPGNSAFANLDEDITGLVNQAVGLDTTSSSTSLPSFTVPANTPQDYIVRAYSGGFADQTELGNVLEGDYGKDDVALYSDALAMNALDTVQNYLAALAPADYGTVEKFVKCDLGDSIQNGDIGNEVQSLQNLVTSSGGDSGSQYQQLFEQTSNDILNIEGKYAAGCATSLAMDAVKSKFLQFANQVHLWFTDPKAAITSDVDSLVQSLIGTATDKLSNLGQGTQRVVELVKAATPVETAIVSVGNSGSNTPQITGISPSPVQGSDSAQTVSINGTGFISGCKINWKDSSASQVQTSIATSVSSNTVLTSMNFGNATGTWEVQIVNPDSTQSNWFQFTVNASNSSLADLVPENVTLSSSSVTAGKTVTVSLTMANQGTATAGASTTRLRLNQSPTGTTTSDTILADISTPSIDAGKSAPLSATVTIPASTASGTYYVWAVADNLSQVQQSNVKNDYAPSPPLTVTGTALPDLVPENVTLSSSSVTAGKTVTVSLTMANQGTATAGASTTRLRLNQSATGTTTGDTILGDIPTPSIDAGKSAPLSLTVTIPAGTASGTYYIWAVADDLSQVQQSNVKNDYAPSPPLTVTGTALPDLVPENVTLSSSSVTAGKTVTVSLTMANQGTATAGASTTRLRLNQSPTGTTTSDTILADISTPSIDAGKSAPLSATATIPASTASGTYYVWAVADNLSQVQQSNTSNDYAHSSALTVSGTSSGPAINDVSPSSYAASGSNQTMTINGSNFQSGATLTFVPPEGGSIASTASKLTFVSSSQLSYQFNDASDAGTWTVTVINPDGQHSNTITFSVTASAPAISSVSPSSYAASGSNQTMTVNGSNFRSGATLTFVPPEGGSIASTASKLTFVSSSQLSYQFNDASDAGTWTVTVTNPDGQHSNTVSFTVAASPAPVVNSISPTAMTADGTNHTLTINGGNFQPGNVVQFKWSVPPNNGVWNLGNAPEILSASQMAVSMNPGTVTDTIYVRVCRSASQTADTDCSSGTQSVAVTSSTPVITSISPSSYAASGTAQTMTINGSNFQSGATVTFVDPQGNSYPDKATTFVSSSELTNQFNDASDTGTWTATVINPDGQHSNTFSFTVAAASPPSITGVSPNPVPNSTTAEAITISGSNFQSGATVTFVDPQGSSYPDKATSFVSSNQLTNQFNSAADGGTWTMTVTNPDGQTSNAFSFTVAVASPPSITGVSPNPVPNSTTAQTITISGSNFQSGATVTFVDPQGSSYPDKATTFVSSSQLTNQFNSAADGGTWTMTVTNPDGQTSNTFSFTVAAASPPSITGVSPSPVPSSNSTQTVTISGGNFQSGATVTFVDPQMNSYPDRATTFVSSSQLTNQFNDGSDPGTWTMTVTNPDGQVSNTFSFTVQ